MAEATDTFDGWLEQAGIDQGRLSPEQVALLRAAFRFRQHKGADYFSTRLLGHFLLHCESHLKVAAIARLLGISRPTASGQQGLSSKEAIQQAHHRLKGRPYGKLLPRFAGPIAAFLLGHPDASRSDMLDFIEATFAVRVSRIALYKFLKKYGLDRIAGPVATAPQAAEPPPTCAPALPEPATATAPVLVAQDSPPSSPAAEGLTAPVRATPPGQPEASGTLGPSTTLLPPGPILVPTPPPPPPFSSAAPSTPAPSCCWVKPLTGSPSPAIASPTSSARSGAGC
jgi:hypothetical protein